MELGGYFSEEYRRKHSIRSSSSLLGFDWPKQRDFASFASVPDYSAPVWEELAGGEFSLSSLACWRKDGRLGMFACPGLVGRFTRL